MLLEAARRSRALDAARSGGGGVESAATAALKSLFVAATDFAGLTSGRVQEYAAPGPLASSSSVVYFHSDPPAAPGESLSAAECAGASSGPVVAEGSAVETRLGSPGVGTRRADPVSERPVGEVAALGVSDSGAIGGGSSSELTAPIADAGQGDQGEPASSGEMREAGEVAVAPVTRQRRRPRERRVPSTPLGRAVGYEIASISCAHSFLMNSICMLDP